MTEEPSPQPANRITGEVSGSAVQVGAVHGDMYVRLADAPAAEPPPVDPPVGWADLPELPPKIASLLRAQIRNAENLPYRLPGARRPSLATVYVRQDVATGADVQPADQGRPFPVLDSKGQLVDVPHPPVARLKVRPPSKNLADALDSGDHMLVTGGPGQGKSTLSLRLAADVARQWQQTDEPPPLSEPVLPLRLTARELAPRLGLSLFEALAETVQGEYGAMLAQPLRAEDLTGRVAGCRWLLLVDGLDEVADTTLRDRLVTVLTTWASDATDAFRVVLTTRPIEGATLAPLQRVGAARYELLPFDEAAFRLFAENWFADNADVAKRFVRQIRDAHLDELVRVPLLATIAAIIFEQYADRPLPDNQFELYETYLGYLKSARFAPPGPFDECCGRLLEHLGRIRLEADSSLVTAACRWVAEHQPELGPESEWREQLVGHLAAVGPFQLRGDDLGFLHHSFAEHLAATAKARLLPEVFDGTNPDFVGLLHAAEPEERGRYARRVLLHYTRLHPAEADRLTRFLHDGGPQQHLLASRLLARHAPASEGVVDAFLATARAWAATSQFPGGKILSQVSRAAHHPGLVDWLRDLMRDAGVPSSSRVEAAAALATRIGNDTRSEAVETLRAVVQDPDVDVQARLDAAEALSQCGADERDVAASGLQAVLDSPAATAVQSGGAAVVLAGLGAEARDCAVDALTALLDSPLATDSDLVAAALSLLEIDVQFHERCATVFRGVLHRRSWNVSAIEDAAVGLASLGPDFLAEAAGALERRIADSRLHYSDRFQAARVLLRLGPDHRVRAGELTFELAERMAGGVADPAFVASQLAACGSVFREFALVFLRRVLDDPGASAVSLQAAGGHLADLGPDHWPEAVQALTRTSGHPLARGVVRLTALGRLATLGKPHKTAAIEQLRFVMSRPEFADSVRYRAASELARLGPEFHAEAIARLTALTGPPASPKVRMDTWRQLARLAPERNRQAAAEIIGLLGEDSGEVWEGDALFFDGDLFDPAEFVQALEGMAEDGEQAGVRRNDAAVSLTLLPFRFHNRVARGFTALITGDVAGESELVAIGRNVSRMGAGPRRVVVDALREIVVSAESHPRRICSAAEAIYAVDALDDSAVVAVLSRTAADYSADAVSRCRAIVLLTRNEIVPPVEAMGLIIRLAHRLSSFEWLGHVREVVAAGGDVSGEIRTMPADRDVAYYFRQRAAIFLNEVAPGAAGKAIAELRLQAQDLFLDAIYRSSALTAVAGVDPLAASDVAAVLCDLMADERLPIDHRAYAAYELARIDPSAGEQARRTLVRFAGSSELTPRERGEALRMLGYFGSEDGVTTRLRLALVHDPATTTGGVRASAVRDLTGKDRRAAERGLVLDRLTSPDSWAGDVNQWRDRVSALEAEQELVDQLAGPETAAAEAIEVAIAFSALSPGHLSKAVAMLEKVARGHVATRRARQELALLSPAWRERVLAEARAVLADASCRGRDRAHAGLVIADVASELPEEVRTQMADLLTDDRIARYLRLRVLVELRRPDDVRAIRDDQREQWAVRRFAARWLSDFGSEDRAAAAELFQAMAADPQCHPRLRWWAADDLAELGVRGHALGTAALAEMMADEALPAMVRRETARALGLQRPDLRGSALTLLRRLLAAEAPPVRIQIWAAIGTFQPHDAALGLLELARDRSFSSVIRCRSAWAAAKLHRDHYEAAAIVVREIAHDDQAPVHIRISAARLLAFTGELCRPEARELITRLTPPGRSGGGRRSG